MLALLKWLWWSWKKVVHSLNRIISWTLMALVYVGAITPVALAFKLLKPDPTDRGLGDPNSPSEWKVPTHARQDIRRAQRPY